MVYGSKYIWSPLRTLGGIPKSTLVQPTDSRELHTYRTIVDGEKKSPTAITPRCPDNRRELRVHATTVYIYIYMYCHHILLWSTKQPEGCQSCSHDQLTRGNMPCPRLRLKIWFRETGLAVPSRVGLLILYTNAESGSRNCVPMAFTAESPLCPNIITAVLLLYIL